MVTIVAASVWAGMVTHLDEHKVPNFQDIRIIHVDQVSSISASYPVVMDLSARPTWALVSHLPEVILGAERQNALCWQVL